jgi:hypothetical protein
MAGDSPSYLLLAGNLARGFYGEILQGQVQPDVLRPPAYPLLLWFLLHVLKLSGTAVIAMQLGAYLFTVFIVERFLRRSGIPGNLFLAVAAIYPFCVVYSSGYMTEPWVMLCYTAAALLLARRDLGPGAAAICGALIGLAGMFRSDMLPVSLMAAAILAYRAWQGQRRTLAGFAPAISLLVAAGLVMTPYALWNYTRFGKLSPAPMAAAAGNSLYSAYWQEHLSNDTLNAFYSGQITPPLVRSGYLTEIQHLNATFGAPPLTSPANPVNYPTNDTRVRTNIVFGKVAIDHFRAEPSTYVRHVAKNVWFLWNMSEYPGIPLAPRLGLQLVSGLICLLGLLGAGLQSARGLTPNLPGSFSLFLFYPFLMHVPLHLEARYTAAARPLLMMFAAVMIWGVVQRWLGALSRPPETT